MPVGKTVPPIGTRQVPSECYSIAAPLLKKGAGKVATPELITDLHYRLLLRKIISFKCSALHACWPLEPEPQAFKSRRNSTQSGPRAHGPARHTEMAALDGLPSEKLLLSSQTLRRPLLQLLWVGITWERLPVSVQGCDRTLISPSWALQPDHHTTTTHSA